jgi:hypothetical protein
MADEAQIAEVVKNGESCILASLKRSPAGLTITVKAHTNVEEFFANLEEKHTTDPRLASRTWSPVDGDELMVYYSGNAQKFGRLVGDDGNMFTLDTIGGQLIESSNVLNLSFLRLVGISKDAGVSFSVRGVYSMDYMQNLRTRIGAAARRFYIDYVRPIDLNLNLIISTQDIRR